MKKILSLALAGLLTVSMAAVAGAMEGQTKLGTIPYVPVDVEVDAVKDAAYDTAMVTEVGKAFANSSDSTATVYAIHDGEYLYVYGEIRDADMVEPSAADQESQPWVCDSLEVMIDGSNKDTVDATQARVDWTGWACWYVEGGLDSGYGDASTPEVAAAAAAEIDGGYAVEMALHLKEYGASAGSDIGLQYQINDVFSDGTPQANITINGMGPWDVPNYPVATLAPVEGYIALDVFSQADVIDDDTTQDQGGSGQPIQLMDAYGCGYSSTNDIVYFDVVDFGANGADFMTVRFGFGKEDGNTTKVGVYLDDPESAPITTLDIGWTGGWEIAPSGYVSAPVEIPAGAHSVYFKFLNDQSGSISEVYFTEAEPAPVEEVVAADGTVTAPATFDAAVVAAVAAIISAAGYAVSKKH